MTFIIGKIIQIEIDCHRVEKTSALQANDVANHRPDFTILVCVYILASRMAFATSTASSHRLQTARCGEIIGL